MVWFCFQYTHHDTTHRSKYHSMGLRHCTDPGDLVWVSDTAMIETRNNSNVVASIFVQLSDVLPGWLSAVANVCSTSNTCLSWNDLWENNLFECVEPHLFIAPHFMHAQTFLLLWPVGCFF